MPKGYGIRRLKTWFRSVARRNRNATAGIAIGVIVVSLIAITWSLLGSDQDARRPQIVGQYFFDLDARVPFVAPLNAMPPIAVPGHTGNDRRGVRAYVFSCDDCGDASKRFIGWLETLTPESHEAWTQIQSSGETPARVQALARGMLVSDETGEKWFHSQSVEARTLKAGVDKHCPGRPVACAPTR